MSWSHQMGTELKAILKTCFDLVRLLVHPMAAETRDAALSFERQAAGRKQMPPFLGPF